MKIFTTDNIREIEKKTIATEGLNEYALIERAASSIAYEIMSRWRPSKRIVVFAGPGNNGADALATSHILIEQGYHPEIFLFNIKSNSVNAICARYRDELIALGDINFTEVTSNFDPPVLSHTDVVIDGLFGSGLREPIHGGYAAVVRYINDSGCFTVAIDLPSGLFGEWNNSGDRRNIIRANLTLAMQCPRLSFFFKENAEYVGTYKTLDIELNQKAITDTTADYYLVEASDIKKAITPRHDFCNKFDCGTVLVCAGSYGMMGAAILASRAAMRSGAGLVSLHAPRCGYAIAQTAIPEALFDADSTEYFISNIELRHKYNAILVGPGIGTRSDTLRALDRFLKNCHQPVVLDADALNCIAEQPSLLQVIPPGSVLTPHMGEFDRIFGNYLSVEERLRRAVEVTKQYGFNIVLKGHYTLTIRPDGKVYVNNSGNSGMATAGSGDVLAGVIAGFMAQGYSPDWAAVMGAYIHGFAGDLAEQEQGTHGVMASDIAACIGKAIKEILSKS